MNTATKNVLEAVNAKHYRWEDLPAEPLKEGLTRRLITSERMMIAHVHFKKGIDVPRHSHENEADHLHSRGLAQVSAGRRRRT